MLFTGLANINLWYPWPFNFRVAHYWVAWITIGALVVHIGAKFAVDHAGTAHRDGRDDGPVTSPIDGRSTPDRPARVPRGRGRRLRPR